MALAAMASATKSEEVMLSKWPYGAGGVSKSKPCMLEKVANAGSIDEKEAAEKFLFTRI